MDRAPGREGTRTSGTRGRLRNSKGIQKMGNARRTRTRACASIWFSRPCSILLAAALYAAWPTHAVAALRTLYVDHDSRGGPCSDAYTATQNATASPAGSKPWCTVGAAGKAVQAGDLVLVRGG